MALRPQFARGQSACRRLSFQDLQVFSAEFRMRPRPGLKAAQAIDDFCDRAGEIDEAVFFRQNWCQSRLRIILRARAKSIYLEPAQGFDHEIRAIGSQARSESYGRIVGRNREFAL